MPALDREILALEELRRSYDVISRSSDTLDQKAGTLLGSASLVTALFGTLQIALVGPGQSCIYWIGILLVLAALLALVALCTSIFWSKAYLIPIKADWDVVSVNVLQPPHRTALRKMISSYTEYIPKNRQLNAQKATRIRIASFLLFLIVAVLMGLSLSPQR